MFLLKLQTFSTVYFLIAGVITSLGATHWLSAAFSFWSPSFFFLDGELALLPSWWWPCSEWRRAAAARRRLARTKLIIIINHIKKLRLHALFFTAISSFHNLFILYIFGVFLIFLNPQSKRVFMEVVDAVLEKIYFLLRCLIK